MSTDLLKNSILNDAKEAVQKALAVYCQAVQAMCPYGTLVKVTSTVDGKTVYTYGEVKNVTPITKEGSLTPCVHIYTADGEGRISIDNSIQISLTGHITRQTYASYCAKYKELGNAPVGYFVQSGKEAHEPLTKLSELKYLINVHLYNGYVDTIYNRTLQNPLYEPTNEQKDMMAHLSAILLI